MNVKHATSVLSKVFNKFLESIDDDTVRQNVKEGTIITGGSVVSLLTGEPVNDYDLYFKDYYTCYSVADYYVKKFNALHPNTNAKIISEDDRIKVLIQSDGVAGEEPEESEDAMETNITPDSDVDNVPEKPQYSPVYITSNAITLSGKIQIIIRFYGDPAQIHENYDFVHCTNYWTSWDRKLVVKTEALQAILAKELVYMGSKYPICSLIRTRKFIKRGWTINAGQYLKMAFQIAKLDLTNRKVLEDQLVGVDSAYFGMLINALEAHAEKTGNDLVDSNYVVEIINKIF